MILKRAALLFTLLVVVTAEEAKGRARHPDPFDLIDKHFSQSLAMQYFWPWNQLMKVAAVLDEEAGLEEPKIVSDPNKFQINILVKRFKPEELSVRVKNRYVIVEGKQKKVDDKQKFAANHFVQSFALPAGCKEEEVEAMMKPNGHLIISAPKHDLPPPPPEREVPIVILLPEETTTKKIEAEETTPKEAEVTTKLDDLIKPDVSTTLELDAKETNHAGKIRKKELKTSQMTRDNEVDKDSDDQDLVLVE